MLLQQTANGFGLESGVIESDRSLATSGRPLVEIVVPVYNEEAQLEKSLNRLRGYLDESFPFPTIITIVDNGSTDETLRIAFRLAGEVSGVRVMSLTQKGRGRALRAAWSASEADVVVYTDVDLSTSLDALLPLVAPLLSGHSDLAIGTRLARGAHVVRGAKRELISRGYNLILRTALQNDFSDAQCGFKAVRADVVRRLLPLVHDESWFFDTELLVIAERSGLRIHEVPVDWVDDPDSRVKILKTASDDLRGVVRLLLHRSTAPDVGEALLQSPRPSAENTVDPANDRAAVLQSAARFARVGILSTFAYALLFLGLRPSMGDYGANVLALSFCAIANFAAHRRLGNNEQPAVQEGLLIGAAVGFFSCLLLTTFGLALAAALAGGGWLPGLIGVLVATALAALVRFSMLRSLVFRAITSKQEQLRR